MQPRCSARVMHVSAHATGACPKVRRITRQSRATAFQGLYADERIAPRLPIPCNPLHFFGLSRFERFSAHVAVHVCWHLVGPPATRRETRQQRAPASPAKPATPRLRRLSLHELNERRHHFLACRV